MERDGRRRGDRCGWRQAADLANVLVLRRKFLASNRMQDEQEDREPQLTGGYDGALSRKDGAREVILRKKADKRYKYRLGN